MLHAAHEGREPALVACTPPFVAEPSNNELFVFAVEKGSPRKCSRFSGAERFGPCRLHTEIYEPIVNCLGIAGGIVKRGAPSKPATAGIIPCSGLPETSNNIIQERLAFARERSGSATVPGTTRAPRDLALPAAWPRWGCGGGGERRRTNAMEDPDGKIYRYATHHSVRGFATR
jgi:hypothetical protein